MSLSDPFFQHFAARIRLCLSIQSLWETNSSTPRDPACGALVALFGDERSKLVAGLL